MISRKFQPQRYKRFQGQYQRQEGNLMGKQGNFFWSRDSRDGYPISSVKGAFCISLRLSDYILHVLLNIHFIL